MESWNEQLKTKILESEFSIKEISDKTKFLQNSLKQLRKLILRIFQLKFLQISNRALFKFLGIDPSEA